MICTIFLFWFLVFVGFFLFHILTKSKIFGVISGIVLLLFGTFLVSEGLQIKVGDLTITNISSSTKITNEVLDYIYINYQYSWVFGLIFIATSFYIIFKNAFSIKDIL